MKYRKIPVVVEARQTLKEMEIQTLEGTMRADPGDWIITGVKGEQYPCKPDIFAATYEPAEIPEPETDRMRNRKCIRCGAVLRGPYCTMCGKQHKWDEEE